MKTEWFRKMVDHLSEGVIIMDRFRKIHYMNIFAKKMTGWKLGELVPYCSYCKIRQIAPGEERCILVQEESIPVFQAHMPTYKGIKESFHMSTTSINFAGERYIVLIMRNPVWNDDDEQNRKMRHLLVQATMQAQETERKRIAMELHDHIGQGIFSAFLGLQGLKYSIKEEKNKKHIINMERSLEQTLEDVKRLSKELHPSLLDHLGIVKAVESAVLDWKTLYQVDIVLEAVGLEEDPLSKEMSLHLFRVIQEAVRNAVHHGKAKKIKILLLHEKQKLYFQVTDDGMGFDIRKSGEIGLGVSHMIERMDMVGGDIKFYSREGGPTKIEGYIPI